jgi:polyhydroxyalkanoate synthase
LYMDPEEWSATAPLTDGSWWTPWSAWLAARSGAPAAPPDMGAADAGYPALEAAPGHYVLER